MKLQLFIYNKDKVYEVSEFLEKDVRLTTEINSTSELNFTFNNYLNEQVKAGISFVEGNSVELLINDNKIFKGYIFSKSRNKDQSIRVVAYDQIRYLKNKETYIYTNKKANEVVKMICEDFKLNIGELEDTKYIIPNRFEDNQSLLDIVCNAFDETFLATKEKFYIYDDFGKITVKNGLNMFSEFVVSDKFNISNFSYKTDIDTETYNQIKLYKDTDDNVREVFMTKDRNTQAKWGVLQYYEQLPEGVNDAQAKEYAINLLNIYNKPKETLSISCLSLGNGEEKIRAGLGVYALVDGLGEKSIAKPCAIEKCTHTFSNNEHTFELDLII